RGRAAAGRLLATGGDAARRLAAAARADLAVLPRRQPAGGRTGGTPAWPVAHEQRAATRRRGVDRTRPTVEGGDARRSRGILALGARHRLDLALRRNPRALRP